MVNRPLIDKAFSERPDLKKRVWDAISQTPQYTDLFTQIAEYTTELKTHNTAVATLNPKVKDEGPASKKRRLDDQNGDNSGDSEIWREGSDHYTIEEISFTIPQRKKLTLELSTAEGVKGGLRARNPTSGELEFGIAWKDIEHVVCLPLPEKAQRQYTFCVFPRYGDGVSALPEGVEAKDPMVWTVPDTPPKAGSVKHREGVVTNISTPYKPFLINILNQRLEAFRKEVVEPDEKQFASSIVQSHRKGEKAFHVKAFRGSKDGFLFFLRTGIIWTFKKPLSFFAFDTIDSISYTSVLQRTFNLNITTSTSPTSSPQNIITKDFEFSMLDQADFAGIDEYVKRNGLQDASMAEQRRARKVNVNGGKEEGDEEGELEKAKKEIEDREDEEDEEEEDYDPGSEGESEGEGTSDEEEDGDGDGGGEGGDAGEGEEGESEL